MIGSKGNMGLSVRARLLMGRYSEAHVIHNLILYKDKHQTDDVNTCRAGRIDHILDYTLPHPSPILEDPDRRQALDILQRPILRRMKGTQRPPLGRRPPG